jgi:hypothetical protein
VILVFAIVVAVFFLEGIGIFGETLFAVEILPALIKLTEQGIVVARRLLVFLFLVECGFLERLMLSRGLARSTVAVQGMHRFLEILLWGCDRRRLTRRLGWPGSATLHPRRSACGSQGIVGSRLGSPRHRFGGSRGSPRRNLNLGTGTAYSGERIVLTNEASKLSQRVAVAPRRAARSRAAIQIIGHEVSILVTISHRDDASPSG